LIILTDVWSNILALQKILYGIPCHRILTKDGNETGLGRVKHPRTHTRDPTIKPAPDLNCLSGGNPHPAPNHQVPETRRVTRNPSGDGSPRREARMPRTRTGVIVSRRGPSHQSPPAAQAPKVSSSTSRVGGKTAAGAVEGLLVDASVGARAPSVALPQPDRADYRGISRLRQSRARGRPPLDTPAGFRRLCCEEARLRGFLCGFLRGSSRRSAGCGC
jgi:hypothetical protein